MSKVSTNWKKFILVSLIKKLSEKVIRKTEEKLFAHNNPETPRSAVMHYGKIWNKESIS